MNGVKKRQQRLDFINERLQIEKQGKEYIKNIDAGIEAYYGATGVKLPPLLPKSHKSDFYQASDQQKDAELVFIVVGTTVAGVVSYKHL